MVLTDLILIYIAIRSYVTCDGDYVLNDNCIVTDLSSGCESYAYGKGSHGNYRVTVRIV